MAPQVSVIIPAYDRWPMLREAIASVFAQRDIGYELIVVDDGSTDGTQEGLDEMRVPPAAGCEAFIRLRLEHRRGPAVARNYGALAASGKYLAFLDSDDLWKPEKLVLQCRFMQAHPELALCQTQEIWLRAGVRVNPGRRHLKRHGDFFELSLRTCLISPSAVMIRAGVFADIGGFDEAMTACEDYDLWLRLLCSHEVGLLDRSLVVRRAGHPGQLSAITPALDRFRIRALLKLLATAPLDPARREAVAAVLAEKSRIMAQGLARRGDIERADYYRRVADAAVITAATRDPARWRAMLKEQPLIWPCQPLDPAAAVSG